VSTTSKPKVKSKTKRVKTATVRLRLVVDRSGSMRPQRRQVVDGINQFMTELQQADGDPVVVAVDAFSWGWEGAQFDTLVDDLPLESWTPITEEHYVPAGGTPLNDAVARAVTSTEASMDEDDRALVVIFTDGQENKSKMSTSDLRELLQAYDANPNWEFIYLGANVDSFGESANIGLRSSKATNWSGTAQGTSNTMRSTSKLAGAYRSGGEVYAAASASMGDLVPDDMTAYAEYDSKIDEAIKAAKAKTEETES
jgi:uncharacterized protein YegL